MIGKGSKIYSVVRGVCPRCQEGKVFTYAPFKSIEFTQMNEHCVHCGQAFEPEPDFYQGAMYVSYGLSSALFLSVGVLMLFFLNLGYVVTFSVMGVIAILSLPIIFRVSRLIWLNFFVSYRPSTIKQAQPGNS
jgi:uncharacterized protein (DUF983 family)